MMMSKKKIIALAMSAVMAVGMIAGCGSTNNSGTNRKHRKGNSYIYVLCGKCGR